MKNPFKKRQEDIKKAEEVKDQLKKDLEYLEGIEQGLKEDEEKEEIEKIRNEMKK
ncbi:hypothetical protein ACFL21_00330 [Patescibacteria group bacterium]